ncbi:MAG: hypothetical protein AB7R89_05405 [Dehalococcoidia bacterium]
MSVQAESEAEKLRRVPGIYFADSPSGRQAYIVGTGLGVFEIVRELRDLDTDWEELRGAFHWLSEEQLRTALVYYEAYPEEIDAQFREEEYWTPERTWERYPFTKPSWRP